MSLFHNPHNLLKKIVFNFFGEVYHRYLEHHFYNLSLLLRTDQQSFEALDQDLLQKLQHVKMFFHLLFLSDIFLIAL